VESRRKIGIDDHLALGRNLRYWNFRNPGGLRRINPPGARITKLPPLPVAQRGRDQSLAGDLELLNWLRRVHGDHGAYAVGDAVQALRVDQSTIWRRTERLKARGVLQVWAGKPHAKDGKVWTEPHLFSFSLTDKWG
jgi:hypothetical protein